MEPFFLRNLNPASVDPAELVDSEADSRWLERGLRAWLDAKTPRPGTAFCVLGDKGIGKSILTRRVIADLAEVHRADALFLTVDCRPLRNQRDVYREAATQLVRELAVHRGGRVSDALFAEAQIFETLTRFDEVELKHAHEHLIQYKVSLDLGAKHSLVSWMMTALGIQLTRNRKSIDALEGSIAVDGPRLREAFIRLVDDLHEHAELRVVLYLDNVEELNHEALRKEDARERVRADVEALIHLGEGPLALVLNMRNYYSSVLTRRIDKRRRLRRLAQPDLRAIIERRLGREAAPVQASVTANEAIQDALSRLAELATTPLAYLIWAAYLLEEGLCAEDDLERALLGRLETHYATVARFIPEIAALFESTESSVEVEAVLAACGGSNSTYRQLIDHQVLLPTNYWDPREFHLDPELAFLIGRADLLDPSD